MPEPSVHLIAGMVCAGKTTLARRLEAETQAHRFSPDEWLVALMEDVHDRAEMDRLRPKVEALQWQQAQAMLKRGASVILENGFWHRDERLRYCAEGQALGARVELTFLNPPRATLERRIVERNASQPYGSLVIGAGELERWLGWLERPAADELERYDDYRITVA